jgi:copper(I)-binding protein
MRMQIKSVLAAAVAASAIASAASAMDMDSHALGDLTLSAPFARASLPNAPVAGGYVTVVNNGATDDRLVAAASDVAGRMEVHEMAMDGDVMKMRELADGLPIPAGETVVLKPGGYHIMFMKLNQPLEEGQTVEVTLTFEKAGEVSLPFPVHARDATGGDMGHSHKMGN